ncbi:MAG TPA: hypothetical protein VFW71_03850 [Actinomycetota bacterium]|nr:hypothetical protein [Actinomycetota bacterium]
MFDLLPVFDDVQAPFPGMDYGLRPALRLVPPPIDPEDLAPGPSQLRFGWEQLEVWDVEPEPLQPSLLPPPTLWEEAALLAAVTVRPPTREPQARPPRRGRRPVSGQLALFG